MSALPSAPNSLSINQIAQEYGGSTPHSMSEYYGDGDNVLDGAQGDGGAIPESGAISIGDFFGGRDRVVINLTISSNTQSYQISQQYGGTYEAGFTDIILTNNAQVGSTAVATAGIYSGTAPNYASGDTLKIVNAGHIRGRGGDGGAGANNAGQGVGAGQIAGDAIETTFPLTVVNNSGAKLLGGGGGGGGGGRGSTVQPGQPGNPGNPGNPPSQQSKNQAVPGQPAQPGQPSNPPATQFFGGGGGGGGAGNQVGSGGSGGSSQGQAGQAGGADSGGSGGSATGQTNPDGGAGGAVGAAGGAGQQGGAAGAAGHAIESNGNQITLQNSGQTAGATS